MYIIILANITFSSGVDNTITVGGQKSRVAVNADHSRQLQITVVNCPSLTPNPILTHYFVLLLLLVCMLLRVHVLIWIGSFPNEVLLTWSLCDRRSYANSVIAIPLPPSLHSHYVDGMTVLGLSRTNL